MVSDYVKKRHSELEGTLAFQVLQKEKMPNDGQFSNYLRACPDWYIQGEILLESQKWHLLCSVNSFL